MLFDALPYSQVQDGQGDGEGDEGGHQEELVDQWVVMLLEFVTHGAVASHDSRYSRPRGTPPVDEQRRHGEQDPRRHRHAYTDFGDLPGHLRMQRTTHFAESVDGDDEKSDVGTDRREGEKESEDLAGDDAVEHVVQAYVDNL